MGDKIENEYHCLYCDNRFKQKVGFRGGGTDSKGKRLAKISSQVKCPRCKNFLETWG